MIVTATFVPVALVTSNSESFRFRHCGSIFNVFEGQHTKINKCKERKLETRP